MNNEPFNLETPPGFAAVNPDKPVHVYERHMPHWRQEGATYFVTFRQVDSLPQSKLNFLKRLRDDWERRRPPPRTEAEHQELAKQVFIRLENWLDEGYGSCLLRVPEIAGAVADTIRHFDGDRYLLGSFVIMPNHVHAVVRPLNPAQHDVEDILQSWKGFLARKINHLLARTGRLWQEESYDRLIRDLEHLFRCIQYIGWNRSKAGIEVPIPPWIRPDWRECGWEFEADLNAGALSWRERTDLEVRPTECGDRE